MPFLFLARFSASGPEDSHRPNALGSSRTAAESSSTDPDAGDFAALKRGDTDGLSTLIRKYAGGLEDYAYTFVRADDAARDVVQEVFVALWERRGTLFLRGTVASYLYRAVRNGAVSALRHERSIARLTSTLRDDGTVASPVSYNDGAAAVEEEEFLARVDAALASLPPRCREIFLLHRDQGRSYAEIAAIFGIGLPTIHVQMSRAVRRLQEYLLPPKK